MVPLHHICFLTAIDGTSLCFCFLTAIDGSSVQHLVAHGHWWVLYSISMWSWPIDGSFSSYWYLHGHWWFFSVERPRLAPFLYPRHWSPTAILVFPQMVGIMKPFHFSLGCSGLCSHNTGHAFPQDGSDCIAISVSHVEQVEFTSLVLYCVLCRGGCGVDSGLLGGFFGGTKKLGMKSGHLIMNNKHPQAPRGMPCTQCAHSAMFWMSANTQTLVLAPSHKFLVPYQGFFTFLCI